MDLTTGAGFALEPELRKCLLSQLCFEAGAGKLLRRLAVNLVRRLRPGSCAIIALRCNSFSVLPRTQLDRGAMLYIFMLYGCIRLDFSG